MNITYSCPCCGARDIEALAWCDDEAQEVFEKSPHHFLCAAAGSDLHIRALAEVSAAERARIEEHCK